MPPAIDTEMGDRKETKELLPHKTGLEKRQQHYIACGALAIILLLMVIGTVLPEYVEKEFESNRTHTPHHAHGSSHGTHEGPSQPAIPARPSGPLTIYYWPPQARASALFRMCDAAGQAYTHVSDNTELAAMVSSNIVNKNGPRTSDMFAPPVVKDGEFTVGQSVAATLYLGQKLRFDPCIKDPFTCVPKAIQHLNDLQDLTVETHDAVSALMKNDPLPMNDFLKTGRLAAWLTTIENSIVGPYYYGEHMSYVDFYLLQTLDWFKTQAFNPLQPVTGDLFLAYPKVCAIEEAMHAMNWYKNGPAASIPKVGAVLGTENVALYNATGGR